MDKAFIFGIGFLAQALFSSRILLQWLISEKNKKVLTPILFWEISLFASFLLFVYGHLRNDFSIMLGQSITYYIYVRNMQLENRWNNINKKIRYFIYLFPLCVVIYYYNNNNLDIQNLLFSGELSLSLILFGVVGQILFTLRFVYQWIYSEKIKKSKLPLGFWVISLIGSILILIYGIMRIDWVLIVGHVFGIVVYSRNLIILRNEKITS